MYPLQRIEITPGQNRQTAISFTRASLPTHTVSATTRTKSSSTEYYCDGGGTFCCILLVLTLMILLLVQILIWRIFDIDVLPVDDSISNYELSNSSIHSMGKND